jgi:PAS domain S-box-containing protein
MDAPPRSSRSSAAELARLFAALPMGVLHLTDERVDYANEAVANMLGYTPEELIGEPIMEMLTDDTRPLVERRYRARQKGEVVPERYELEIHRRDRKVIRLEIEPVVTGPRQHLIMVRDVTDRLRDTSLLAALSESALRVQRAGSVEQALLAAGSGLTALGLHLMVARLEGDNLVIEYVAATGDAAAQIERLVPRPLHGMVVPVGHVQEAFAPVLRERRMIFVEEAAPFFATKLLRWRPELDSAALQARLFAAGFGRCVLCPLLVEGAVWGMLGAAANNLTSADAAALGLYASHVASAIETNRAIARLERRNQELAAVQEVARAGSEPSLPELLKRLVRIASDLLHAEAAAIWLLDE